MKLVICQLLHSLNIGGAEMLANRLATQLGDEFRFVFICLDDLGPLGERLRDDGFAVEVLGRRPGFDLGCVRQIVRAAQRHGADLIHAHQYTPFFYARAPGWVGSRLPVLFTEHGRFHPDLPSKKRMAFNRLFLRKRDRVVAVGEAVKRALVNNEGMPAQRIEVVYNGVPLADFDNQPSVRGELRAELGIGVNDPVAIQVARLDYLKDHSTALRTAERVRRSLPNFRLVLVGDGPERPKIEREIAERQLGGTVLLLGQRSDIRRLLSVADMFLLTSISEGIPVTFIEAMAAGLPIVSTAVGGVEEVVVHGETGLVAPSGDDGALATATLQLISDSAKSRTFGVAGRDRAEQMFSERQMHARYQQIYAEMINRVPASAMLSRTAL